MCLSNFKAIRQFKVPISWLRDFTRSYEKTSFRILRRGPAYRTSVTEPQITTMIRVLTFWCWEENILAETGQYFQYFLWLLLPWLFWFLGHQQTQWLTENVHMPLCVPQPFNRKSTNLFVLSIIFRADKSLFILCSHHHDFFWFDVGHQQRQYWPNSPVIFRQRHQKRWSRCTDRLSIFSRQDIAFYPHFHVLQFLLHQYEVVP